MNEIQFNFHLQIEEIFEWSLRNFRESILFVTSNKYKFMKRFDNTCDNKNKVKLEKRIYEISLEKNFKNFLKLEIVNLTNICTVLVVTDSKVANE